MSTELKLGEVHIVQPEGGQNLWQPVPANGHISVRLAPKTVNMQHPFALGTQTVPPGCHVREHSHPVHDEVLHFISGAGKAVIEGVDHLLKPGTTIFIGMNRKHMFVNTGTENMHWLWFIQPNGLEDFFEQIGRTMLPGEPDPAPFPRPDNVLEIERRTAFNAPPPGPPRKP